MAREDLKYNEEREIPQHLTQKSKTSNEETVIMYEAEFANDKNFAWKEWDNCLICGFTYPKDQIVYVNGGPYCIRFKHYLDPPGTGGIKEGG